MFDLADDEITHFCIQSNLNSIAAKDSLLLQVGLPSRVVFLNGCEVDCEQLRELQFDEEEANSLTCFSVLHVESRYFCSEYK